MSRIEIISTKQRPNSKYIAVHNSNYNASSVGPEYDIINTFPPKKVLIIPAEKDFDHVIKIFLIKKLRKYYVTVLWIGFLVLFALEILKSEFKKIGAKADIDLATSLHYRKIAEIALPLVSMVIMIFLCITVYRLLSTASIIKIKRSPVDKK